MCWNTRKGWESSANNDSERKFGVANFKRERKQSAKQEETGNRVSELPVKKQTKQKTQQHENALAVPSLVPCFFFLKGDEQDYFPLPCRSGWSRLREQTFPSAQVTWPQCTKPVREEGSCPQQAIPPTLSSPWLSRQTNHKSTGSGGAWRCYVSWAHKPPTSHGGRGAFSPLLRRDWCCSWNTTKERNQNECIYNAALVPFMRFAIKY